MKKIWELKKLEPEQGSVHIISYDDFVANVKEKVKLSDVFLRLLYIRGITNHLDILKFFKPQLNKLYNPFEMKDCDVACERILQVIKNKETIMVTSDYDVDGTCGASMFYLFLKNNFGIETDVYIPDRENEGYGISESAIRTAHEKGIKLIVAIDFGITASEKIRHAKSYGIDFIICDHHQPPEVIPDALAVLDPLRTDCKYPYKFLCGTGVAFKLIQAVSQKLGKPDLPNELLDFVALATSSDIAPLVDENRILVSSGFDLMNSKPRPSIKKLIENLKTNDPEINTMSIIFSIAPRLNAVGRMGDAKRAFEFLTCEDEVKLDTLLSELNVTNSDRREMDQEITRQAIEIYEGEYMNKYPHSIVLHKDDWHPGVVGIVAARLVERYNLPSIVLTTINTVAKGSARSVNGFNIYEILKACENDLVQFGGHYHAAGLEIAIDKIDEFRGKFDRLSAEYLKLKDALPEFEFDAEIKFSDIDYVFLNVLNYFEPYGPGNPVPVFLTKDVVIEGQIRNIKNYAHLFRVREISSGKSVDTFFPFSEAYKDDIVENAVCNIYYTIDVNYWNNVPYAKLKIKDMSFK